MRKVFILLVLSTLIYVLHKYGLTQDLSKSTPNKSAETISIVEAKTIEKEDERITKLVFFFKSYNSELEKSAKTFVEVADKYKIDYRILPAIAGTESTFGKKTPSCATFNSYGWTSTTSPCGFYRFKSHDDAIVFIGSKIATKNCYRKFMDTGRVEDLAVSYNNGSQTWINSVKFFMNKI